MSISAPLEGPVNFNPSTLLALVLIFGIVGAVTFFTFGPVPISYRWRCKNRRIMLAGKRTLSSPFFWGFAVFLISFLFGAGSELSGQRSRSGGETAGPIYFITPTQLSILQIPKLTKIAQALFPHREKVVWVVVSVTTEEDLVRMDRKHRGTDGKKRLSLSDFGEGFSGFQRMNMHLTLLKRSLDRFGVPYVFLRKRLIQSIRIRRAKTRHGATAGLLWTLQNAGKGVVLVGNEGFAYHSKIFEEVEGTDLASMWACGLGTAVGFSAPIWDKLSKKAAGYYTGNIVNKTESNRNFISAESIAFNLQYIKQSRTVQEEVFQAIHNNLTVRQLSFKDPESDIQILGEYGSEILVWRTNMVNQSFPSTLRYPVSIRDSSILKVWRNLFTVFYDQIPLDLKHTDAIHKLLI